MNTTDLTEALHHAGIPARPPLTDADLAYLSEASDDPRPLPVRFSAALRHRPELSAAAIARSLKITRQRLSASKIRHLRRGLLIQLATKLAVDWEWLYRGHSDMEPDFLLPYSDLLKDWRSTQDYARRCGFPTGELQAICQALPKFSVHPQHAKCIAIVRTGITRGNTFPYEQFPDHDPAFFHQVNLRWQAANLLNFPLAAAAAERRGGDMSGIEHGLRFTHRQVELLQVALGAWSSSSTAEEYAEYESEVGHVEHLLKFALRFDLD